MKQKQKNKNFFFFILLRVFRLHFKIWFFCLCRVENTEKIKNDDQNVLWFFSQCKNLSCHACSAVSSHSFQWILFLFSFSLIFFSFCFYFSFILFFFIFLSSLFISDNNNIIMIKEEIPKNVIVINWKRLNIFITMSFIRSSFSIPFFFFQFRHHFNGRKK